jgi:hypothetical protein
MTPVEAHPGARSGNCPAGDGTRLRPFAQGPGNYPLTTRRMGEVTRIRERRTELLLSPEISQVFLHSDLDIVDSRRAALAARGLIPGVPQAPGDVRAEESSKRGRSRCATMRPSES